MPEKRKFQGILQLCPSEMESRRFWCKVMWHANNKCEMYPSSYWWDTWDSSKQICINQESTVSVNGRRGGGGNSELDFSSFERKLFCWTSCGGQINTWRILKIITLVQLYQWYSVSVTPGKQITVLNVSSPLENLDVTFLSWQEMLLFTIAQCTMHCTIAPLHNCIIAPLHNCTIAQFQCTTDCVVKKTCYAICGKHLVLNVGMWGWFKADQLKYDHVAARKAWPQPLKSSINAPPKPALPSSAYDQLTWSHTSDLWSNQTKYPKTATSTFLSPIAFINFATWLTLKI